jgi:simple sugar transport system permease protein
MTAYAEKRKNEGKRKYKDRITRAGLLHFIRRNGLQLAIIGVLVILETIFIIGAPDTFLHPDIYRALMTSIPYWGVIALPLTVVIIAGEMDLSFISTMAVGMLVFVRVYDHTDSLGLAFVVSMLSGFGVGLVNGLIIVKLGIPSLIATIGAQFFWRGMVEVFTKGQGRSLVDAKDTILRDTLVSKVFGYWPAQMIWMILVAILVWVLLNRHKFGAHVYLIGDNEASARLMGVNVDRTRVLLFAIVGLAAAFGGVIQSLDVWYFWPNLGEGYLMNTLAAVFLGGTSVFGGTGTIVGTLIGCFIIGAIQPGIIAMGYTAYYTKLIYGLIIVVFVALNTILRKRIE